VSALTCESGGMGTLITIILAGFFFCLFLGEKALVPSIACANLLVLLFGTVVLGVLLLVVVLGFVGMPAWLVLFVAHFSVAINQYSIQIFLEKLMGGE
jgi:hypothetical protein